MATPKRRINLDLSDPAFDFVFQFAAVAYPGLPTASAIRELLLVASGADPMEAASAEARKAARHAVTVALRQKIMGNLSDALDALRAEEALELAQRAAASDSNMERAA